MRHKVNFVTEELEDLRVSSLVVKIDSRCAELKGQGVDGRTWQRQDGQHGIDYLHDGVPKAGRDLERDQILKSL